MQDFVMQGIFYLFATIVLISGLMVITQNNPVRAVLSLVVAFIASAFLWILVRAEFLALILVLVYVGAVMTLFLFVVMMLNIDVESLKKNVFKYLPFGLIVIALLVGLLLVAIPKGDYSSAVEIAVAVNRVVTESLVPDGVVLPHELPNTESLGLVLYTDYVLAFEMAAMVLLVAIIGAITLVHRPPIRSKRQDVVKQIMTRRNDRVTLVKLKSEK